jgi:hypothetical protein
VEASRGCPFKCEFCLSSLDKTAWAFDLDAFMAEMDALYQRGARNFKFVDRTFNLKVDFSVRILQFFLDRLAPDLFIHFEVVPDSLHDRLKELIAQFPAGSLQFEVGIQSFNPDVQQRISRRQDNIKTADNLRWLVTQSQAHVHADLIFGLPGETPITRHTADYAMVYEPQTPYTILQNSSVDFVTMQRIKRFARYWDLVVNSGRFSAALKLLLHPGSAFNHFLNFSDWLWQTTSKTHEFAHEKLVDLMHDHLVSGRGLDSTKVLAALLADYTASGARGRPQCLVQLLNAQQAAAPKTLKHLGQRQARHVALKLEA